MTLHERIRAWWEDFYYDNPVVWLTTPDLHRALVSSQPKSSTPLMKPALARRIAYGCWGISLVALIAAYLTPVSREVLAIVQDNLRGNPVIVGVFVFMLSLVALTQVSVIGRLLAREHEERTWTFAILTRLSGSHFVYGRVLPSIRLGGLIFTGIYCSPFILCTMIACYGWAEGIARTLQSLWIILTSYCFLLALGTRVCVTTRSIVATRIRLALFWFTLAVGFYVVMSYLEPEALPNYIRWLRENPQAAFDPRAWIISLYPILFLVSLFAAPSLFWGVPQGFIYLFLAWRLFAWSGQVLEAMRRLPEPVRKQEEGT